MARPVDQHIHSAMKAVSQALALDKQEKNKEAYVQYLKSVQFLVQTLIEDAQFDDVTISTNSKKFVKLGMQCMDRIGELSENGGKGTDSSTSGRDGGTPTGRLRNSVTSPTGPSPDLLSAMAQHRSTVSQAGAKASSIGRTPAAHSRSRASSSRSSSGRSSQDMGPLVMAQRQNQQLMAAYKARLEKMSASSANKTNLSLSLQRRLAENMAVARARQTALEKKMAERQKRLEAEAARRFASTAGMSSDEQERRHIYTQILEYEQDTKWLLKWREKLKLQPEDIALQQKLIREILGTKEHPLTQLLGRYQYAIYDRLNPLVSQHLADIQAICVPYEGPLPESQENNDAISLPSPSFCSEGRMNSISSDRSSQSGGDSGIAGLDFNKSVSMEVKTVDALTETSQRMNQAPDKLDAHEAGDMPFTDVCEQTQQDLEKAMSAGQRLIDKLTEENKNLNVLVNKSKSEVYNVETFDDLFEDGDEEVCVVGSAESCPDLVSERSSSCQQTRPTDLSGSQKDLSEASAKGAGNPRVQALEMEALQRHLVNVIAQVREYLEKIQAMFIVAYEMLDSAAGKDLCCSCLEEPFFKPIWPYLLCLFRICNQNQERLAAVSMTRSQHASPAEFRVEERFCPDESLLASLHNIPYEPAVSELQQVAKLVCPLSKLECVVRVCRVIVQCVEDYHSRHITDQDSKFPNLGADDLLPIMCYVIARSGLPQLVSECQAMEEFVHEGYLMGEEGYCLTSLQTALGYVIKVGSDPMSEESAATCS